MTIKVALHHRTHYAFVIEEGIKPEDFYRERHREIFLLRRRLRAFTPTPESLGLRGS